LKDVQKVCDDPSFVPKTAHDLCHKLFYTSYMGTEHSSKETRSRAKLLAQHLSSYHIDCNIDALIQSFLCLFTSLTRLTPQFKVHGGSVRENLALQNLQARIRMVLSYLFAQLLPWSRGQPGSLLVLGSANVDETIRGYLTKYDCSSADLNPVGGISKSDLQKFVTYMSESLPLPILKEYYTSIHPA
jgi:NAD+ synthase (glutamine-hydrolysing)